MVQKFITKGTSVQKYLALLKWVMAGQERRL